MWSHLCNQFEANRFNLFTKHQHPKRASALLYPMHIISDLGHMASVPIHHRPSRLVGERRRGLFVALLKGGGGGGGDMGGGGGSVDWLPGA